MLGRLYSSMFWDEHPSQWPSVSVLSWRTYHMRRKCTISLRRKSAFSQISYIHNTCGSIIVWPALYTQTIQELKMNITIYIPWQLPCIMAIYYRSYDEVNRFTFGWIISLLVESFQVMLNHFYMQCWVTSQRAVPHIVPDHFQNIRITSKRTISFQRKLHELALD